MMNRGSSFATIALLSGVFCINALPSLAAAWRPADRAPKDLAEQLNAIKASRTNLFFSDCIIGDNVKAALILKAGSLIGQYFILGDRIADGTAYVAEQGEFSIKDGVSVQWWSGKDKREGEEYLGSLVRQPMRLLLWTQTDIVFKQAPTVACSKPAFNK